MPSIARRSFLSGSTEDIGIGAVSSAYSSAEERSQSWVRGDVRAKLRFELKASVRIGLHPSQPSIPPSIPPCQRIFILFGWAERPWRATLARTRRAAALRSFLSNERPILKGWVL